MHTERRNLSFPKLTGLRPTLESTALKLMEEAGELAQAIGKFRGMSGETGALPSQESLALISGELLDVAQTAATMMYVLQDQYGVDLDTLMAQHEAKLKTKGYLV